jgi:mono/diheme cytochrome c family protein
MSRQLTFSLLALGAVLPAGCDQAEPPNFRLNMVQMVSNEIDEPYQAEIANVLGAMFGTPDDPQVLPESGLDQTLLSLAAGPAWSDKEGASHGLYRRHCVHCHGITGDGRGPTAQFLDPYPRDYRKGVFKFKSTFNPAKPTDDDLRRVLHEGVPGTSMPSFSLLPKAEVEALVEYVKYLALRGEVETALAAYVFDELGEEEVLDDNGEPKLDEDGNEIMRRIPLNPAEDADQAQAIKDILADRVSLWEEASEQVIEPAEDKLPEDDRTPEEIAESVAKGRELFFGATANCVKCHGPTALGDGQQTEFDNWAKEQQEFRTKTAQMAETVADRASQDLDEKAEARLDRDREILAARQEVEATLMPTYPAIPRNLRKGVFRGGHRRIDVFWRIHTGIAGTPMPGIGGSGPGVEGVVSEEDIWHIVDYVLSLPYEPASGPLRQLPENVLENAK